MLMMRARRPGGPEDVSGAALELLAQLSASGAAAQELREQPLAREVLEALEVGHGGPCSPQRAALGRLKELLRA
jgi:hypothetical protein